MLKNSTEFLDYALRELQVAIEEDKKEVEIILSDAHESKVNEIINLHEKLNVMVVAELLRMQYPDYSIKSIVWPKLTTQIAIKIPKVQTITYYPIVWKLSLQKKVT